MVQIQINDISKVYTVGSSEIKAVDGASLEIEKGEFVSITGHSGSGKTTLLSIIGGILMPSSGKVFFGGTDIYSLSEDKISEYRAEKIGYIFQFASLLPVLTVEENLFLPTIFTSKRKSGIRQKTQEYLSMVGLSDKINSYPSELSGGEQRRVAIARALMNDPEVILADEPTGDLDEETEAEVMEFLKSINRDRGITFILVTHSTEIARSAKKMIRMSHGRLSEVAISS
ncbi:MAG: ABC transporter ATP-binding protein [Nitrospirae bacterium]|nr:ABC transporter ATP-binding protein [Nitrospirota bacterium]